MKLKVFKYLIIILFSCLNLKSQNIITGFVKDSISSFALENVKIIDDKGVVLTITDKNGYYHSQTYLNIINLSFINSNYNVYQKTISFSNDTILQLNINLMPLNKQLDDIKVVDKKNNFGIQSIDDVRSNTIYSGKKSELIDPQSLSSKASNSARQIFKKAVSLNITQTDDVGLQLNVGGRGLNPRRSSNFNMRQNGYNITPDPLGYPESYYVPPFESLESIELVRGAGALQYGTQFGGMINFKIKKPPSNKSLQLITRNTIGSHQFFSNFSSLSGTIKKIGYYTFFNYKKGDGFRPNSDFNSYNFYSYLDYRLSEKIKLSFEFTYLDYLAHQPGGLTDMMFYDNIYQSNRERNWFDIKWLLYNIQANYTISERTKLSINALILDAHRRSVGFRTNRVDQVDSFDERDLISAEFNNFSVESKLIHHYNIFTKKMTSLIGGRFYLGSNSSQQGPGSDGFDANFNFQSDLYPNYENQSYYENPNLNFAIFNENIIYLNDKMAITPGARFEYIKTMSDGYYRSINTDAADNVILNELIMTDDIRERQFILLGLGYSFKIVDWSEFYSNCSQNYRAVTFADINTINPNFIINPSISDENGYTLDFGFRGNWKDIISYDVSSFYLFYNNRIGFIQRAFNDGSVKNEKGNIGDARILGQEFSCNFNLVNILKLPSKFRFNYFINNSFINSEYIFSKENGVQGNDVEFVPKINLKTGLELGFLNFKTSLQYTFLSNQFTDATNSIQSDLGGVIGEIPQYEILDFSCAYMLNNMQMEFGINNALNRHYFTTRATGYPGPGIIPSPTRNIYFTFEYKF